MANVVCHATGLASDNYSLPYVAVWSDGDPTVVRSRRNGSSAALSGHCTTPAWPIPVAWSHRHGRPHPVDRDRCHAPGPGAPRWLCWSSPVPGRLSWPLRA